MDAAQKGHLHGPGQFYIGDELAVPMQVALVLSAQQRGADSPGFIWHRTTSDDHDLV